MKRDEIFILNIANNGETSTAGCRLVEAGGGARHRWEITSLPPLGRTGARSASRACEDAQQERGDGAPRSAARETRWTNDADERTAFRQLGFVVSVTSLY
jgi:hypothetical protein